MIAQSRMHNGGNTRVSHDEHKDSRQTESPRFSVREYVNYNIQNVEDTTKFLGKDQVFIIQMQEKQRIIGERITRRKNTLRRAEVERGQLYAGIEPDQAPSGVTPLYNGILAGIYGR